MGLMIRRYNQQQILMIPVHLLFSVLGFAACLAFFYWGPALISETCGFHWPETVFWWTAGAGILAVIVSGFQTWTPDQISYSSLGDALPDFEMDRFPKSWGEWQWAEVSVSSHLLTHLFLSGPYQLANAWERFRNLIPEEHGAEPRLRETLDRLIARQTWHGVEEYAGQERELSRLIRMGYVSYSPALGRVKAK